MREFKVDVGYWHLIPLFYSWLILVINLSALHIPIRLSILFQSHTIHSCQNDLKEQIEFIGFSDKGVFGDNCFLINQIHFVDLYDIKIVDDTSVLIQLLINITLSIFDQTLIFIKIPTRHENQPVFLQK